MLTSLRERDDQANTKSQNSRKCHLISSVINRYSIQTMNNAELFKKRLKAFYMQKQQ